MKRPVIGWREWVQLPELGVFVIKAKVDTGAATSSLHAFQIERFEKDGLAFVRFEIHPRQRTRRPSIECEAPIVQDTAVRNPGGCTELRPVISSTVVIAGQPVEALINLTGRDDMGYRMLLGRRTLRNRFVVDPGKSYLGARPIRNEEPA
ncbi:MAG: RimK/LysX family protein [Actinomycetota bacterium]|nr:RimK/LysX family protein [Actinomycetota bacterium]